MAPTDQTLTPCADFSDKGTCVGAVDANGVQYCGWRNNKNQCREKNRRRRLAWERKDASRQTEHGSGKWKWGPHGAKLDRGEGKPWENTWTEGCGPGSRAPKTGRCVAPVDRCVDRVTGEETPQCAAHLVFDYML